jgi:rhomboid protease GluP
MFGMGSALRELESAMSLWPLVGWVCGALYVACLVTDPRGLGLSGGLALFPVSIERALAFGASGAYPVFELGRWWTLLSAGWLHGGLLHLGLNMYGLWQIAPAVEQVYGTGRAWVIYTLSGVTGFALSTFAGTPWMPRLLGSLLGGGGVTLGASAALFGLLGALLHASRTFGKRALSQRIWSWALFSFIFGLMPGLRIDNWAHLGGFIGGYALSLVLNPHREGRSDHVVAALVCLAASAAAIIASLVTSR